MGNYTKFIVALVGLAVGVAHSQGVNVADDISQNAIAALTAVGVWLFPNSSTE